MLKDGTTTILVRFQHRQFNIIVASSFYRTGTHDVETQYFIKDGDFFATNAQQQQSITRYGLERGRRRTVCIIARSIIAVSESVNGEHGWFEYVRTA